MKWKSAPSPIVGVFPFVWLANARALLATGCAARSMRAIAVVALALFAFGTGSSAQAAPLFDFSGNQDSRIITGQSLGYSFTVFEPITILGFGLFDIGSDGLKSAHDVALWNADGDMIRPPATNVSGEGTSSDGSESPLGKYVYEDLDSPLPLESGQYILGAYYDSGNLDDVALPVRMDIFDNAEGAVSYGQGFFQFGDSLVLPDVPGENYFGPALHIASTIPEPTTVALLLLGVAGIGFGRPKPR